MARIELRHLQKTFGGGIAAVKDLDLVIEEGELLQAFSMTESRRTT